MIIYTTSRITNFKQGTSKLQYGEGFGSTQNREFSSMGDTISQFTETMVFCRLINFKTLPTKEFETADLNIIKELMSFPAFYVSELKNTKPNTIVSFETMTVFNILKMIT